MAKISHIIVFFFNKKTILNRQIYSTLNLCKDFMKHDLFHILEDGLSLI